MPSKPISHPIDSLNRFSDPVKKAFFYAIPGRQAMNFCMKDWDFRRA